MRRLNLAVLVCLAATVAFAQTNLVILTGSTSGVYYPVGNALSTIFMKAVPGARSSVQVTQGSVENLKLLQAGDGELAFTLGDTLSAAWKGDHEAGFKDKLGRLRGVAAIYRNYIQIVVREGSGVKVLEDLKGKRVSVGPKQSGTELNARAIFTAAGLKYSDFSRTEYLPFGQSAKMMEKGELDATLQSAGLGVDSIRHLSTAVPIRFISVASETIKKIGDVTYVAATIPERTYEGQSEPVETAAVVNFLVTREGLSSDIAYAMTKSIFSNLDQLVATHPAAQGISIKDAVTGMPIPMHPGAERYYRDIGVLK
jgi:uncharacterized protein